MFYDQLLPLRLTTPQNGIYGFWKDYGVKGEGDGEKDGSPLDMSGEPS